MTVHIHDNYEYISQYTQYYKTHHKYACSTIMLTATSVIQYSELIRK